ncbi:MAG: FHA domain-containing protein [Planctomycetes bacterium]|nr:FHA domain-containing protein [Planctomycetota bacterium]
MPYLEIKLGPDTLLLRFVGRIDYAFGRLPRADVQLRDMKVSRLHTQVFIDSRGNAFVRDLGSSGGTSINNQRLRRGVIAPLVDGSKVRIGDARVTYYDAEPPVNATDPPSQSHPRGLIRTNPRERHFEADQTVLAMDKVDPETQSGPAEPPPEINPNDFGDDSPRPAAAAPAAAKKGPPPSSTTQRRDTGIVEAPWDKRESGKVAPGQKRLTVPPPTRRGEALPPPQMESAEIDEHGNFHIPGAAPASGPRPLPPSARPVSPLPPREALRAEAPKPPAPAPKQAPAPVPKQSPAQGQPTPSTREADAADADDSEPISAASEAFSKPAAFHGEMRIEEDEEPRPRLGMPTVRLERPAMQDRRNARDADAAESDEPAPKIPTAKVDARQPQPSAPADDAAEPEPQIGKAPPTVLPSQDLDESPPAEFEPVVTGDAESGGKGSDEEDLTDEQIADYLGASASGHFDEVDFGESGTGSEDDADAGEAVFGSAKVSLEGADDIDIEGPHDSAEEAAAKPAAAVEDEPADEQVVESTTSMLGHTTAIKEEPEPEPEPAPQEAPTPEHVTPPPVTREGATADREFKPRKTRKLMKRRTEALDKKTDKTHETPPPAENAKTEFIARPGDQPVAMGAKTMFIPKPGDVAGPGERVDETVDEDDTGVPKRLTERAERRSLAEMGEGPGGDTVALPPGMASDLRAEMEKLEKGKRQDAKKEVSTIGDHPTVKTTPTDDAEDEEFIVDDSYAFFTPPPPTRRGAAKIKAESDVIDANDFHKETDNLPPEKKAKSKDDPDTLVE